MQSCGICCDDDDESQSFIVLRQCNHCFCGYCIQTHVKEQLQVNMHIPKCPCCLAEATRGKEVKCMTKDELLMSIKGADVDFRKQMEEIYDKLQLEAALETLGCVVKCPGQQNMPKKKHCETVVVVENKVERICVNCPSCRKKFCSICYQLYHFRITCEEARAVELQYKDWLSRKSGTSSDELDKRVKELQADEAFKEQNCRHCPNCNRIVQKIDGCDAMICGKNFHVVQGDNLQFGCQKAFNWRDTKPYVVVELNRFSLSVDDEVREAAGRMSQNKHGVNCTVCSDEIVGLRFSCINCESFDICEKCEKFHHSTIHMIPKHEPHAFEIYLLPGRRLFQKK